MSKKGKYKRRHGLDQENRVEEAVYELHRLIANSEPKEIGLLIHQICSRWKVKRHQFRSYWQKIYLQSPEEYQYDSEKGLDLDLNFSGKKIKQQDAWIILQKMAENAKTI